MHTAQMLNSFICLIDRSLPGIALPSQSGPGSNGNEGKLHICQIYKTGASPSDYLMSFLGHSLEESYPFAVMQSVYSTTPADWVREIRE